jgi:hypothetical protein
VSILALSHFEGNSLIVENLETQDCEIKLEGEKEELFSSFQLVELNQQQFLYKTINFNEPKLVDYVVYLKLEDKPPRHNS